MGDEKAVMSEPGLGKVLVTGGGGFLGSALVEFARRRGLSVRSLSRRFYPQLESQGVEQIQGDVSDHPTVERAVEGCQTVFHTAAKAGLWGLERDYERSNVQGTKNVIAACRTKGARRIIFTSSPSVVFNGRAMEGADETAPYCERYDAAYPRTKAVAEKLVVAANGKDLAAVSIRPHLIWGPGDNNFLPRIIKRARSGRLRRIGGLETKIDPIYIDNAAMAHFLAADKLEPGSPIAGKIYFVTQGEIIPLWEMIDRLLGAAGLPPVRRAVSRPLALATAGLLELGYFLSRQSAEPPLTRFLVRQLTTTHWFNIAAARRDLGYEPKVTIAEGLARLKEHLRESRPRS
jgi:nucleoside-diphosphate-sugar epimerase